MIPKNAKLNWISDSTGVEEIHQRIAFQIHARMVRRNELCRRHA